MLLGRDVPHFRKLLKEALEEESSMKPETNSPSEETKEETRIQTSLVTTRAQLDRQHLQDLQEQKEQEEDEPVIHSVDSDSPDGEGEDENTLNQLDEVDPSQEAEPEPVEVAIFDTITPDHLKKLQKDDPSLQKIREKTKTPGAPYFWKDDILMRQPYHTKGKELVIIPKAARMKVLQLAHNSPVAGHFGRARTLEAIRTRMDWPGIATDVRKMCSSCPICQKASPALLTKAPLHPLPIIKNPFQRVAMDIFGPLK